MYFYKIIFISVYKNNVVEKKFGLLEFEIKKIAHDTGIE